MIALNAAAMSAPVALQQAPPAQMTPHGTPLDIRHGLAQCTRRVESTMHFVLRTLMAQDGWLARHVLLHAILALAFVILLLIQPQSTMSVATSRQKIVVSRQNNLVQFFIHLLVFMSCHCTH
jgi:hypothetical protein